MKEFYSEKYKNFFKNSKSFYLCVNKLDWNFDLIKIDDFYYFSMNGK